MAGRYRKIDVRVWIDGKFRSLTDDAKLTWFYLLTNPNTTSAPGLYRARLAAIADDIGWSTERFAKAFTELSMQGMAMADWGAGVIWIPNAVKHNPPENPNVVKAWIAAIDEVPESPLRDLATKVLREHTKGFDKGFAKPFPQPFRQGLPNQEQEQEQEQKQKQEQKEKKKPDARARVIDSSGIGPSGSSLKAVPSEPRTAPGVEASAAAGTDRVNASAVEAVCNCYPNRDGRLKGLALAKKAITTVEQLERFELAIKAYTESKRQSIEDDDMKFVKSFPKFMESWEDFAPTDEELEYERMAKRRLKALHDATEAETEVRFQRESAANHAALAAFNAGVAK